jgi:BlaR1 peptidase M56
MNSRARSRRAGDLVVDRELVLLILGAVTLGPLLLRAGMQRCVHAHPIGACALERTCWQQIWAPLVPSAIVCGALVGWVVIEPEEAEVLPLPLILLAAPFLFVWMRATVRAIWSLRRPRSVATAATIGLIRPRVIVASDFLQAIDPDVADAVAAHEAAHARHRDPLRVWTAQLVTDLQWPGPGAVHRLTEWRHALELARDEEIRRAGIDGADLAAAVITALRFGPATRSATTVSIVGGHERICDRVGRLLAPLPETHDESQRSVSPFRWSTVAGPLGALVFGAFCGEAIVRALVHAIP